MHEFTESAQRTPTRQAVSATPSLNAVLIIRVIIDSTASSDTLERMRTPVRHISYDIRHTALSRTYAIVAYVRHNNNAGSPVFGISGLPLWPESSQLQMKLQYAWNQRTTHPFLWFKTHGCEWIGDINVCIIKSKDWPIDILYNGLLVGPTKMATGAFKGAQWKTIIMHSLHARAACQQAIINARGGGITVWRTRNSWVYMISNSNVQSDSRNWKFANKNTYNISNRIPREIWLSWRSILGTNK